MKIVGRRKAIGMCVDWKVSGLARRIFIVVVWSSRGCYFQVGELVIQKKLAS